MSEFDSHLEALRILHAVAQDDVGRLCQDHEQVRQERDALLAERARVIGAFGEYAHPGLSLEQNVGELVALAKRER